VANLTITVDDAVLRRARIRALEQGTSVNALLRKYLTAYSGEDPAASAVREIIELARDAGSGSGPEGRRWNRDDLHER
jgi:plasmid stability protein